MQRIERSGWFVPRTEARETVCFRLPLQLLRCQSELQLSLRAASFVPRFSGVEHLVVLTCFVNQVFSSAAFRQPRQAFTRNLVNSFSRPILFCTSVLRLGRFSGVEHSVALNLVVNSTIFSVRLVYHDTLRYFSSPTSQSCDFRRPSVLGAAHHGRKRGSSTLDLAMIPSGAYRGRILAKSASSAVMNAANLL